MRTLLVVGVFGILAVNLFARAQAQTNGMADLLARINRERIGRGLAPYALNAQLTTAAQNHANYMVSSGKYGHVGADGSQAADRAARAGYGAYSWGRRVGENWANYHDAASAMAMWMESLPHRNNILHALYREIGIGITPTSVGTTVYVLVFGAQPNVLPVFINDGATRTTDLNVRLTLTSEDVAPAGDGANIGKPTQIQISNTADFAGATWQPFASSLRWTLASEGEPRTVYVKYRDAKGRTVISSASIVFGTGIDAPVLRVPVAQVSATSTRPLSVTPRSTATFTRPATRGLPTPEPSATPTSAPTVTSLPTPTEMATLEPTVTLVATQTPWIITATPELGGHGTKGATSPDLVMLGMIGFGLLLSVLVVSKRLAS